MNAMRRSVCGGILLSLLLANGAFASEQAKSVYLLGATASMAGMTPPPGFHFSSTTYLYDAQASGAAALSRSLNGVGNSLPSVATIETNAEVKVGAQVALDILALLWVAPDKVMGGQFGIGVLVPIGYQNVDVKLSANSTLTLPNGNTLDGGRSFRVSQDTFALGDPLATAFIGWNAENFHWKLTGLVNIPVGSYSRERLVNMGFNHWAADLTGAVTWLDPTIRLEVSAAAGFTFNGKNPATNYKTGTEFHLEGAVMQHFSKSFAIGPVGYHYRQVTGDSGSGAVLGSFKGEVSALGVNASYNFQLGTVPVFTSVRWLREFNATNRAKGDAGFLTVTVPIGGSGSH